MVPPLRASTDGPTQFSNGKRLPDLTFLQDFLALFFEYKDEDRFRDGHLFERALHAALISVRAVALNKDLTGVPDRQSRYLVSGTFIIHSSL